MGDNLRSSIPRSMLAAAGVLVLVGTLFAITRDGRGPGSEPSDATEASSDAPLSASALPAESAPEQAEIDDAVPDDVADAERPGFDLVRVTPDGAALVAGRAAPGARVTIAADGTELAAVDADADGNFVAIFEALPGDSPRAMTLETEAADGSRSASDEVVMLLPRTPPTGPSSDADAASAGETEGETTPGAIRDDGFSPAAGEAGAADDVEPEGGIAATAILRPGAVEAQLTAPATGDAAEPRRITLASISYADAGDVTLAGAGTAGARLRAYVDDDLAREAAVGPDGRWTLQLADVARGLYRLRIDELAADGRVASRVETPFQRDFPTLPRHRPGSGDGTGVSITVQPGSNLWTIARTHYGSGVLYSQIFTANRDLIRSPDLIYPGQVLALPGATGD